MVHASKDEKGKAKADPLDDIPLEFRAEEHTSVRMIERNRRCRPNSGVLMGMYARHHQRNEKRRRAEEEEAYHRERRRHLEE